MLALALGGRTVAELKSAMSAAEFSRWAAFYRDQPFDDLSRYHRPAALVAQSMRGGDINDLIDYLHPPHVPDGMSEGDMSIFKAFGIKPENL